MRLEGIHDGLVVRGADGNKFLARHHLAHGLVHIRLETQVAVRHNTHQHMLLVHHRDTADMILMHHLECIAYCLVTEDGYRISNHAVLCTFDAAHLCGLLCDRHVLMNHAYTAFASDSDSHRCFRDSIHRRTHHRDIQPYMARELAIKRHLTRQHFAVRRY